jgi:hypothetical protein
MPVGSRGAYTFVDIILAIILPPLGVFLKYGCQVNILNTLFESNSHKLNSSHVERSHKPLFKTG